MVKQQNILNTTNKLWKLAYPTMLAMALQSFYDIVDMTWIGQYSENALSGITIFSVIFMVFAVLNEIAGASSVSMLSQSYGRGDPQKTQIIAEQTISFKIVLAIISAILLGTLLKPLLTLFSTNKTVIQHAIDYGVIRIFFLPFAFASYSVNTIFRCTGDSKTPMRIMFIATIINFILDPILIFDTIPDLGPIPMPIKIKGFGLGIFGAGLATVISITISFILGFTLLLSSRKKINISLKGLFRLEKNIDLDLLKIGLPSGFTVFIRRIFITIMMKFVSLYGDYATAIAGVGGKIMAFAIIPIFGLNMAGSTLVGHSLGKENIKEASTITITSAILCTILVSIVSILVFLFPQLILSFFFKQTDLIISDGTKMLYLQAISMLILALTFGIQVIFMGSGHTSPLLHSTIISAVFVQFPCLILTVLILKLPLHYVWLSNIASEITNLLLIFYHYKKGVWKNKRV